MTLLADLIRQDVPLSTGAFAEYPFKTLLEKKYRFTSRFGDEVLLHKVVGDKILLPRALCPIGVNDNRIDGLHVDFPKCPEMRPDQVEWFGDTINYLLHGHSGLTLAGTGRGKTVCGYYAAYHVKRKTLVICTKDDIYQQWITGAEKFLGLQKHEIGEIRQDKCEVVGTKFVVAMIHSLSIDGKYPDWIGDEFGLIIFDECHRVPAEQFQVVASMFRAKLRLGLTATLARSDGKELLVQAHIGPVRAKAEAQLMVPKILRFRSGWECPRVIRRDKETNEKSIVRLPHEAGKTTHIEKIIAADPVRNKQLAYLIREAFDKDRRIVVFSTLIDHLQSMHNACHSHFGIKTNQMGFYGQASNKAEREAREKVKVKPVVFTTFTMCSEGTDVPWWDTCVLAMPRSNVEQAVGRIRREYDGKKFPAVIDLCDMDSPVFSGYANNRWRWYQKIGAQIVEMD